jgi:hypothetical protein
LIAACSMPSETAARQLAYALSAGADFVSSGQGSSRFAAGFAPSACRTASAESTALHAPSGSLHS